MKTTRIRELINDFLHNEMPEDVQHRFRRWMLAPEDREAKDAALRQVWNDLLSRPSDQDYRQKLSVLHRRIESLGLDRPAKRRFSLRRLAAAAALLALLLGGEYLFLQSLHERSASVCLVTAHGSKGEFVLPDGTHVWLNGNSRLAYPKAFDGKKRKVRLDGNAFFQVRKDASRPFIVDMDVMQVQVLGTEFDARHRIGDRFAETVLKSGSIQVSAPGVERPIPLQSNQRLFFDVETGKIQISNVRAEDYCSWTSRHLIFSNKPLDEILINLENWYDVRFHCKDDVDLTEKLSFHLEYEPLEETLYLLSRIAHVEYYVRNNEVFLTRKK